MKHPIIPDRWLLRITAKLLLIVTVISALVIGGARLSYGDAPCLRYDTYDGTVSMIDPSHGARVQWKNAPPVLLPNTNILSLSDNSKHITYLVGPRRGPYTLYIDKKRQGYNYCSADLCYVGTIPPRSDTARVLSVGIPYPINYPWVDLRDGRILYLSRVSDHEQKVIVENIDRSNRLVFPGVLGDQVTRPMPSSNNQQVEFVSSMGSERTLYFWSLLDNKVTAFPLKTEIPYFVLFSPSGDHFASIAPGSSGQTRLNVGTTKTQSYATVILPYGYRKFNTLIWSADEKYFLLFHDGTLGPLLETLYDVDTLTPYALPPGNSWSEYGHLLLNPINDIGGGLTVFDPAQRKPATSIRNIGYVGDVLQNDRIIASWQVGDSTVFGTIDLATQQLYVLSDNIYNVVQGFAVRDDQTIVYALGNGTQYAIETVDQGGTNHQVLLEADDLKLLYTLDQGKSLIYVARRNGTYTFEKMDLDDSHLRVFTVPMDTVPNVDLWKSSTDNPNSTLATVIGTRNNLETIELVDLATGTYHIVAEGLAKIDVIKNDSDHGRFIFEGVDANQNIVAGTYVIEGNQFYSLNLPRPTDKYSNNMLQDNQFYPSQDTSIAAYVYDGTGMKSLYFTAADGSRTKLVAQAPQLVAAQGWSPDGTRYAFAESDSTNPRAIFTIRVVDSSGTDIQCFSGFSKFGQVSWTTCH